MATPEENRQKALDRAAQLAEKGDSAGAARWEASAARYEKIIEIQARLDASRERVEEIRSRFDGIENYPAVPQIPELQPEPEKTPDPVVPVPPVIIPPTYRPRPPRDFEEEPFKPVRPVPETPPKPPTPEEPTKAVKSAPIDTILFDQEDTLPIEVMADLIFENIGGQELINIARNDTINGQQVIYQPIKNLSIIQQQYNPNNIISLQYTLDKFFSNFPIKINNKTPYVGTGENGAHIYIDPENGDLVVEAIGLDIDEQIEIQITTRGTIYERTL